MTDSRFTDLLTHWGRTDLHSNSGGSFDVVGYFKRKDCIPPSGYKDVIREIQVDNYTPIELAKAEDIMEYMSFSYSPAIRFQNRIYLIREGSLFRDALNPKDRKLVILFQYVAPGTPQQSRAAIFDKDIVMNPEESMNRFILRKLIPRMSEKNMLFGFADLSSNLVQPSPPVDTTSFNDIRDSIAQMCHDRLSCF